ncbi:MAG: pilin [Patescibacteria group bacterium]|nr:pilin [Patescibacteria group bacterium]
MLKKLVVWVAAASSAMAGASAALAGVNDTSRDLGASLTNIDTSTSAWTQLDTIINYFLTLIGLVTFIFLLYGGVVILTAQGNDEKVTEARKIIMYAILGVVVIVLAYAINNWIFGSSFFVGQ